MFATIVALLQQWEEVFPQKRTAHRAIHQVLSLVCVLGRRTLARAHLLRAPEADWSSEYRLHSRSAWDAQSLFDSVLRKALDLCEGELLPCGADDTRVRKTGQKIATAALSRDPLSPAFHVNLVRGLRFLHTSVLVPHDATTGVSARALPVWFAEAPTVKKPGKKATAEERAAYRREQRARCLPRQAVEMFRQLRRKVDAAGGAAKTLVFALDGSYCNKTVFSADLDRTVLVARTRRDARLCFRVTGGKRIYGDPFTPDQVRQDESRPWVEATIFHGGTERTVHYKEVSKVLWQRGAGPRELRLLVVRPVPYRKTKQGKPLYRQPAFLLTTDHEIPAARLLQIYFDRWQVEVAHRELKETCGLGEAQVRNPKAVARQPVMIAALYSILHCAALLACDGRRREELFGPLPKYQRHQTRVSAADLIRFVRNEVVSHHESLPGNLRITEKSLLATATR